MVVEEVYGAGGFAAVVVLVGMLAHCTVGIIARVVALRVASAGAPHVRVPPVIAHLHPTYAAGTVYSTTSKNRTAFLQEMSHFPWQ